MYIVNLNSMRGQISTYLEDEKKLIRKNYRRLDTTAKYMSNLEICFTKDLLNLIDEYQNKVNSITDMLLDKEAKSEFSSTNRKAC